MAQAISSTSSGSLAEFPPLREQYGSFKAFGWDFERADVIKWAEEHGYPGLNYLNSLSELVELLPEPRIRFTRVRDDETYGDKVYRMGLIIATNRSEKDRRRALDKELIDGYRAIHGWDRPPKWFDHVPSSSI